MLTRTQGLWLLAAAALALRVVTVGVLWTPMDRPTAYEHGRIAENILSGKGFSIEFLGTEGPTSQQAPFYPYLLAAVYWLLGVGSPQAIWMVQLLQCLVGTGLVLAVVGLSWNLAPERRAVGWWAGAMAAVFPIHLYAVTHLQVAIWAAAGLTALLGLCVYPKTAGTTLGAGLAGGLAGGLLLVDPILLLAWPVALLLFWQAERRRHPPSRWRPSGWRTGLMTLVGLAVISPWTIRNWQVHGELIFIKDTFGYAFWQGNNPWSFGTDKIPTAWAEEALRQHDGTWAGQNRALWEARHRTLYIDDLLLKPTGYREFQGLSEPQRSRLLGRRAWEFVRTQPEQYGRLVFRRLWYFLLWDQTNPKASHPLYRITSLLWLVGAAVGWITTWPSRRQFWPTWLLVFLFTAFHSLVITSARFRIPVEPIGMVWAAYAIEKGRTCLAHFLRPSTRSTPDQMASKRLSQNCIFLPGCTDQRAAPRLPKTLRKRHFG